MGNIDDGKSVLHMFNKGYNAATNNYFAWTTNSIDRTSHPKLEDNNGNGNTGTQGSLNPSDSSDEGWLAKHTYL